ncbi:AI-2E family transporter [Secundilactobacillus malefermentans]|uniref:AI-2E family transporter n=1 Tax=Secundilactobacillus malefermentans TaxID=176292 RepID=UPI0011C707ED|nr:AI-2E family transporter [Secundilactobacillus malefermentans]QEA31829.1 AI-2E family transporter [Secundilactobacillus malefermentans]
MKAWEKFVGNIRLRRFTVLLLIMLVLYLVRAEMSTILLTFIFTLLIIKLVHFIQRYIKIPTSLIVVVVYAIIIWALYVAVTKYLPQMAAQAVHSFENIYTFYQDPSNDSNQVVKWIGNYISQSELLNQFKSGIKIVITYVTGIGSMGVTLLLSLILSFFFTVEEKAMARFSKLFLTSDYGWFFQDITFFAKKFINTFGVVLEAQFFIALCNTVITTVALAFMKFPQLPTLAIMIFFLSLIPVAGVIISVIPLAIIAYSVGGFNDVIAVVIVILVVHMLEAYVLNPKFMSSRTELPIFYTFVLLIGGEALFGVWGLIVSVPIFTFFLDILGVKSVKLHGEALKKMRQRYGSDKQDK